MWLCSLCGLKTDESSVCPRDQTPMVDISKDVLVGTVVGGYRVESIEGAGVFGMVYRARDLALGKPYALKVLRSLDLASGRARARFRREVASLAAVKHPNVVALVDDGELPDERPYVVLEWIEGRTLRRAIKDEAPFSVERAGRIFGQITAALAIVHEHGFIHRDLKSSNVMLRPREDGEQACVLDFGLVGSDSDEFTRLTQYGQMLGTPLYCAPEVLFGAKATVRSDLYSLGVIAYEMLVGSVPFRAPSLDELRRLDRSQAPKLEQCGPYAELVQALLQGDPADRPADAREVLAAVAPEDPTALLTPPAPTTLVPATPEHERWIVPFLLSTFLLAVAAVVWAWSARPEDPIAIAPVPTPAPIEAKPRPSPTVIEREAPPDEPPPPPRIAPIRPASKIEAAAPPPAGHRHAREAAALRAKLDEIRRRLTALPPGANARAVGAAEQRFLDLSLEIRSNIDAEAAADLCAKIDALERDVDRVAPLDGSTYGRPE